MADGTVGIFAEVVYLLQNHPDLAGEQLYVKYDELSLHDIYKRLQDTLFSQMDGMCPSSIE